MNMNDWGGGRGSYLRLSTFGMVNMRDLVVLYLKLHDGDKLSLFGSSFSSLLLRLLELAVPCFLFLLL